jgi:hypothetical protein
MKNKLAATLMVSVFLISILSIAVPIIPTSASPTEIRVPEDYTTIQAAVDAASSGDIINVATGTYVGAIVDKNVTILGGRNGKSTITSGVAYKVGGSLYTAFRLDSNADGAKIKNFTINCDSTVNFYFAIFSRSVGGVIIDSLTVNDAVQGITNYGGSNWQITNNLLNNTEAAGGGGIAIYLGVYPPYYAVCSGNLVQKNTITATATAPDYTCPGIGLGVDMRGQGLDVLTGNEDMSNNQILNNTITAPGALNGVGIEIGVIGLGDNTTKIAALLGTIHDNTVKGNIIDGADMGVYFYTVTKLKIQQNEIKNCNEGIHIEDGSDGNTITSNNIVNNVIGLNMTGRAQVSSNTVKEGRVGIWLGPGPYSASSIVKGNTIKDFIKAGIVNRNSTNFIFEGNTISTTVHDEAPNGIDIGMYTGVVGKVKDNKVSGCSWKDFTGEYETSWSGSGILVIESGDSIEITGNTVYECDVGMDIESDSMNITCNNVYKNIYGFVFWNAKPKVNYNNIYNNTQYGVYRTSLGDLTDMLDARYNWWGNASGPYHLTLNPGGQGNKVSDYVAFIPWLLKIKEPPLIHDVAVTEVTPTPAMVEIGGAVSINVTVKNKGNCYENITLTVTYGSIIIIETINDFVPGATKTFTYVWDTTGEGTCLHPISAIINPVPGETYLLDNHRDPNVAIVSNIPSPATVKVEPPSLMGVVGGTVKLNITINNLDAYWDLSGFNIKLYYNTTILDATAISLGAFAEYFNITLEAKKKIDDVAGYAWVAYIWNPAKKHTPPSGSGILVTITFLVTAVGEGDFTLRDIKLSAFPNENKWCVPYSTPIDCTTTDGSIETKLPMFGDVNRDGTVDIYDITTVCIAYDSTPQDPNWNPDADIAPEFGIIDIYDVTTVLINYGKTDP